MLMSIVKYVALAISAACFLAGGHYTKPDQFFTFCLFGILAAIFCVAAVYVQQMQNEGG